MQAIDAMFPEADFSPRSPIVERAIAFASPPNFTLPDALDAVAKSIKQWPVAVARYGNTRSAARQHRAAKMAGEDDRAAVFLQDAELHGGLWRLDAAGLATVRPAIRWAASAFDVDSSPMDRPDGTDDTEGWDDLVDSPAALPGLLDFLRALKGRCKDAIAGDLVPPEVEQTRPDAGTESAIKPTKTAEWLGQAILLVKDHPEWPDAEIARQVGKSKSTLSRNQQYQQIAIRARQAQARTPRRGHVTLGKDDTRGIEAVAD